jgi:hypothetical protein
VDLLVMGSHGGPVVVSASGLDHAKQTSLRLLAPSASGNDVDDLQ